MIYSNGNIYQGSWQNGKREGRGTEYDQKNNQYYYGQWKN